MQDLIRMQENLDALSDSEFFQVIKTFDRHKFGGILFAYFYEKFKRIEEYQQINDELSTLNEINNIIADVITSRTKQLQQESQKLDALPSVMISHISSFIHFSDIINFERCNRSIFIATRSASKLFELSQNDFNKIWKHCIMQQSVYYFYRFASLKRLNLYIKAEYDKHNHYTPLLNKILNTNQLNDLQIYCDKEPAFILHSLSQCNLSNISCFKFNGYKWVSDIINLLKGVSNAEYITLRLENHTAMHVNQLALSFNKLSKIKALQIFINATEGDENDRHNIGSILDYIGNDLQSLHCDWHEFNERNTFESLKELCICSPSHRNIDILIKQNIQLERIDLDTWGYDYDVPTHQHKHAIQALLSLKSLKYMGFEVGNDGSETFEMIVNILSKVFNSTNNKYETMVITIQTANSICCVDDKQYDICNDLVSLLNGLGINCLNFILNLEFVICENNVRISDINNCFTQLKELVNTCNKYDDGERCGEKYQKYKISFNNKDCCMERCERNTKWIMPCDSHFS